MHTNNSLKLKIQNLQKLLEILANDGEIAKAINTSTALCSKAISLELPILVCGNGGSAADAQHITGELVGKFRIERKAYNVRSLSTDTSILTAWSNDFNFDTVFSRQVEAYGKSGGVLIVISTSGNSKNTIHAANTAISMGMSVIGFTGYTGGLLKEKCDVLLNVPSLDTPSVQEMHVVLYHHLCESIENQVQ